MILENPKIVKVEYGKAVAAERTKKEFNEGKSEFINYLTIVYKQPESIKVGVGEIFTMHLNNGHFANVAVIDSNKDTFTVTTSQAVDADQKDLENKEILLILIGSTFIE